MGYFTLDHLDPVENSTSDIARALETPAPGPGDEDRLIARLQTLFEIAIGSLAQQAAPNHGLADQRHPEVDIGHFGRTLFGLFLSSRIAECREICVQCAHVEYEVSQRARARQSLPVRQSARLAVELARLPRRHYRSETAQFQSLRHLDPGAQDRVVDHHDGDRCARNDLDIIGTMSFLGLAQVEPGILLGDSLDPSLRDPDEHDGLGMFD